MKTFLPIVAFSAMLLPTIGLASDRDDACGAILCLAGEMTGSSGGSECSGYIKRYFNIVEKHHGDFSPSRTARKRMDFLEQCRSDNSDTKSRVNSRYGQRLGL